MNNNRLQIKIRERLNKLSSLDYDNIECWQIVEAFNKTQLELVRNIIKNGDEGTKNLIDDVQVLISESNLPGTNLAEYFETSVVPSDYLYYKLVSAKGKNTCCPKRKMTVNLTQVADKDVLLGDENYKPSFEWGETFATLQANKVRIYRDSTFMLSDVLLTYYRKPRNISFAGCMDVASGNTTFDVESELKEDLVEIVIDGTCALLAGNMELFNQYTLNKQNVQANL